MRSSIPGILALTLLLCASPRVHAADPQSYRVDIASAGDKAMDDTLRATSELISLRGTAPVSPFGLIARARGETDRLKTVLESYGYYQSRVTIKIDGKALNDAGLAEALSALPKGTDAKVTISFELGPLYHLRRVTIDGTIPPEGAGAFVLKSGAPAVASDVLAAGSRLVTTLQENGYAFAKVDPPIAYEDQVDPVLDVSFHVDAGPRVHIGEIHFDGLQRVHEKLVRRRLTIHTGQRYSPSAIEAARRDLLTLPPIGAISLQVGPAVDSTGGVPITFVFRERLRHAVTVNSAYSTDLGGSGGVTWSDRNVFGNAEQLNIAASIINLGGSATTGIGYDTSAKLIFPDFGHRDQSLQLAVGAINQSLQAYDQKAITTGVTLSRKLSSVWSASIGVATANERIDQEGVNYNYTLVAVPMTLSYDSTHLASPLDDPLHGMRDSLSVAPTQSLGHPSASFVITQLKLAAYFDLNNLGLTNPGRSVIAARFLAGVAQGAGEFSLPPDQRFYGGGSGTIRGFKYQSVGPQFADGNPKGGTAIEAATIEWRQRFGTSFGGAVFVDAGQVSGGQVSGSDLGSTLTPVASELRVGVGLGVRYYTPIGPIRLDVAVPMKQYHDVGADSYEIYIGLGQAF
jgi:translocation and assembly module TamA